MTCKPNCAVAAFASLLLPILAAPVSAATQAPATPVVFSDERLSFPESTTADMPKVVFVASSPQQAAVALPTPQFTGIGAVIVLAILLRCRKSILRLVC